MGLKNKYPLEAVESTLKNACEPSPCGSNAQCRDAGICTCLPGYHGDPYYGCRPECVQNPECSSNKACIQNKCVDPCPGVCGRNAECIVVNHIPMCNCPPGTTGNAFTSCRTAKDPESVKPCEPSPCGPNSRCQTLNGRAGCSCVPGYLGQPPACRPECSVNSDCPLNQACINEKCSDPCTGSCGVLARCQVVNHNPICSCPAIFTGNPFTRCFPQPSHHPEPTNSCEPSPCGPNSECRVTNDSPSCSCLPEFVGSPPHCRPECVSNADCPSRLACFNRKCTDPCPDLCSTYAECFVHNHTPMCSCSKGYTGDPFVECIPKQPEIPGSLVNPCEPTPCGANAICREQNNAASCVCIPEYVGNPYEGCRPECTINTDCPANLACIRSKCQNPCPGTCGINTECQVVSHVPNCNCIPGYTGNPFAHCTKQEYTEPSPTDPCEPSPCGSNSNCLAINGQATCSCSAGYFGSPPNCRPECLVSSECDTRLACVNRKCENPCPDTCGQGAQCRTVNHSPICSCPPGFTGNPFASCFEAPKMPDVPKNPCNPSPCGPNSMCSPIGEIPSCACINNYIGSPPNCRPECSINPDCTGDRACINEKCRDPCPGSCGSRARCSVINHTPVCRCPEGYTGNPFENCYPMPPPSIPPGPTDRCNPSPCGANSRCEDGICTCLPGYQGNPHTGCRPECVINTDCSRNNACIFNKCRDPCPDACGKNAECNVVNHLPMCSCPRNMSGNAFVHCSPIQDPVTVDICNPSPCGPNSNCRQSYGQAACSCFPGFVGTPPTCRPECVVSSDCPKNRACNNQKCIDPCPGTCGLGAQCTTVNHNPICSCPPRYTGNPFERCIPQPPAGRPEEPCQPSPCGANAQCRVVNGNPSCSCDPEFEGSPPQCRPQCSSNGECPSHRACINQKCKDPCPGSCGSNADCTVVSHTPMCSCAAAFTGNPFVQCEPAIIPPELPPLRPCQPSPCGGNAICRESDNTALCSCAPDFYGNPYEGCRPECVIPSDCSADKTCIRSKCQDPCPGSCGLNALCQAINHMSSCFCETDYTGDPFSYCYPFVPTHGRNETRNPCVPSPCGPNSECKVQYDQAICSCDPGHVGTPPRCRPECRVSQECSANLACIRMKCLDPCPGTCGINSRCEVINHSPICSCKPGQTGDAFVQCFDVRPNDVMPSPGPVNPCVPSPCGPFSMCQDTNNGGYPACSCLPNYIGFPPNCRPECSLNSECRSDQACVREVCADPCPGSCGIRARCNVVNHTPVCTCWEGHTGDPFNSCYHLPLPSPNRSDPSDPCEPSPCGPNTRCQAGICTCLREYHGNPYYGCRPECVQNYDCPQDHACLNNKCLDPCAGVCGPSEQCLVVNHSPICRCTLNNGSAYAPCEPAKSPTENPCEPTKCGPNSICRRHEKLASCSCLPGYLGVPPYCRPECVVSSDCEQNKACINEKCQNPCTSFCGQNAICTVRNHNPSCTCPDGHTGHPSVSCFPLDEPAPTDPCNPSRCGPNSRCDVTPDGSWSCTCLPGLLGPPPNCRPECRVNGDCPSSLACVNAKCTDPCPGSCGINAICQVNAHQPKCDCLEGYTGDPVTVCFVAKTPEPPLPASPCSPSPCGANAYCRERQSTAVCECLSGYRGNPYEGCHPECLVNADCPNYRACIRNKCEDPCPGTCGVGAICTTTNHVPICSCPYPTIGNAFRVCEEPPEKTRDPCYPSPCGPNTI